MEKTLVKKSFKKGQLSVAFFPKQFVVGFIANERNFSYLCLGPFIIEWHSINKF